MKLSLGQLCDLKRLKWLFDNEMNLDIRTDKTISINKLHDNITWLNEKDFDSIRNTLYSIIDYLEVKDNK